MQAPATKDITDDRADRSRYDANVTATKAFVTDNDRWPSAGAKGPDEGRLGKWLSKQRTANRDGVLSPERKALLDAELPSWDGSSR